MCAFGFNDTFVLFFFSRSVSRLQYTIVSLLLNGRSGPVAINYIFCEQIPVEKEETKILIQIGYLFIIDNTGECQPVFLLH